MSKELHKDKQGADFPQGEPANLVLRHPIKEIVINGEMYHLYHDNRIEKMREVPKCGIVVKPLILQRVGF